ncbi:MAG: hypothetical protein MUO76_03180, partial [Anaerolineaceae bacterium]|nr:hypothetical protein [Anaerolineaceae bacterium]
MTADADGDGAMELIPGPSTISSDDNGRGVAEYVSSSNTSSASCSSGVGSVNCADGNGNPPSAGSNFLIYWDADEIRELENGTSITKAGGGALLNASGCSSCNDTKSTPTLTADLLGDWREELVLRESDNSGLRVYTTTEVTERRIYTLMHDPITGCRSPLSSLRTTSRPTWDSTWVPAWPRRRPPIFTSSNRRLSRAFKGARRRGLSTAP